MIYRLKTDSLLNIKIKILNIKKIKWHHAFGAKCIYAPVYDHRGTSYWKMECLIHLKHES